MGSGWGGFLPAGLLLAVLYAVVAASVGWGNSLNDAHSFRQSQTATTALYLVGAPFRLAYETPILGKPWAIPMEFPLYQLIVARIVDLTGGPLDQTGRFVSLIFFLLVNLPLHRLLRSTGVSAAHACLPLILFTISPFYLFWSRTFMIESTALFFSVAYLAACVEAAAGKRRWVAIAVLAGATAAAVKVTTFAVYLVIVVAWVGLRVVGRWTRDRDDRALREGVARLATMTAIPFATAVAWVRFTDDIKAANPLAAAYLTSGAVSPWTYGTVGQKCSWDVWAVVVGRFPGVIGLQTLAWGLFAVVVVVTLVHRRRWRETVACAAAALIAPAIFTNVHYVHSYYLIANGIFVVMAMGYAIVGLLEDPRRRRVGVGLSCAAVAVAVLGYRAYCLPILLEHDEGIRDAGEFIRSATPEGSVVICLGSEWSPLVSYYARRRALNLPVDPAGGDVHDALVDAAIDALEDEEVGAIVLVEPVRFPLERVEESLRKSGRDVPVLTLQGLQRF